MNKEINRLSRRHFLALSSSLAGMTAVSGKVGAFPFGRKDASVSFVTGSDRRDNVVNALKPYRKEIEKEIGSKRVIVKVNMASRIDQLCNTHADALRGLLDFLGTFYDRKVTLAECTLHDDGFEKLSGEYGYTELKREYNVEFVELHRRPTTPMFILGKNLKPERIEVIDTFLDPENFIISITPPKTHDVVIATAGLKNIIMASPMKKPGGKSYKYLMHGKGPWWLNYNMFSLALTIRPQLTVIDGLEGMEGDGPIRGQKVEHNFALAGSDVVAVDSVAMHLMGIDLADVGYISYCGDSGLGVSDLSKIKVIGGRKLDNHIIPYKMHKAVKYQLYWKKDTDIVGWDPKDLPY
ncbi:DUF362 domain-containing protein [Candidatus Omnitrophota bacterium]